MNFMKFLYKILIKFYTILYKIYVVYTGTLKVMQLNILLKSKYFY